MITTVIYSSDSEDNIIKTFSDENYAKDFITDLSQQSDDYRCQMLVDYSEVDFFKKKFEELYKSMKDKFINAPVEKIKKVTI